MDGSMHGCLMYGMDVCSAMPFNAMQCTVTTKCKNVAQCSTVILECSVM